MERILDQGERGGGGGVMPAGKLLAEEAFSKCNRITWSPSCYTKIYAMSSQSTVTFPDNKIVSSIIDLAEGETDVDLREV